MLDFVQVRNRTILNTHAEWFADLPQEMGVRELYARAVKFDDPNLVRRWFSLRIYPKENFTGKKRRYLMRVKVRLHGSLRDVLPRQNKGCMVLELPEDAIAFDVVKKLAIPGHIHLAVNEEVVENWNLRLQDADKVEIFRPAAGGAKGDFHA